MSHELGLNQALKFSPAALLESAAGEIVRRFADKLPDLSSLTILLPNIHAAAGFKHVLRQAAARDVLLLPRFATFLSLAEAVPLERAVSPPSLRVAQLYSALKSHDWFEQANLWGVSAEVARLFDELTLAQRDLPESIDEFITLLETSYGAKSNVSMRFEARLVHEMWYAFHRAEAADPTSPLTAIAAYALQLAAVARTAHGPLFVIGVNRLKPAEIAFLRRYAERHLVIVMEADLLASDPLDSFLTTVWGAADGNVADEQLRQRATRFSLYQGISPVRANLEMYGAAGLEDEATTVTRQIKTWLAQGKRNIAVVALDRLAARRVRALLERDNILLTDESGWTLSTTSASTVIMRLLEAVSDGFYHRDVLDLAKSPFFATDWAPERRKRAVHRLERWVRERNIVAGLDRYRKLAQRQAPGGDEEKIVERLGQAESRFKGGRQTLGEWIGRLLEGLRDLGALPGLEADAAGKQLLKLLGQRRQELSNHPERMNLSEWRRWLNAELEAATFRDDAIISPIALTSLSATRMRQFEAVVLIGADSTHLSARPLVRRLFNQSVRHDLGLLGATEAAAEIQEDLIGLIARSGAVLVTWQANKNGEHNAMSPWFARLEAFHKIAYDESLLVHPSGAGATMNGASKILCFAPAPAVPPQLLPTRISASGYASLMACPYQFFARHVLALNEQDEVAEEMEKRDYGELVHYILAKFHQQCPSVIALSQADAETALHRVTDSAFNEHIANNYVSIAWKFRWEKRIPAYVAWQRQWESEGWSFSAAEKKFERAFPLARAVEVTLHGRLDRIDQGVRTGQFAVLDYKTQKRKPLADKLAEPGEDVQLAVYALLVGEEVVDAAYVSLDEDQKVVAVTVGEDLPKLALEAGRRLGELFNSMADGDALPANGVPRACQYCEMRGLCRLDYWDTES
jgi:ATP-dependent helicase/nuclease subunit B